jgi:hypothetical protein
MLRSPHSGIELCHDIAVLPRICTVRTDTGFGNTSASTNWIACTGHFATPRIHVNAYCSFGILLSTCQTQTVRRQRRIFPAVVAAFPKIRNGRLEWMQVIRSNDIFRGMPYNFVQFTSI